jgi:Glycosyl hydrolase catalytic core/Beta-galactosidase
VTGETSPLRGMRSLVGCALALAVLSWGVAAAPASAQVPREFWGVIPINNLSAQEINKMGAANVGTLRQLVLWPEIEPSRDNYNWSYLDFLVAGAAANGIEILPFPYGTPSWVKVKCRKLGRKKCVRVPPLSKDGRAAWIDFLQDFVGRYGPQGAFWTDTTDAYDPPYLPITEVQVWNEPSSQTYWQPKPKPKQYGALVKISHDAIAAVDPGVQIVLAGLFPSPELGEQYRFTKFLQKLFQVKGIGDYFDIAAFHPYARTIARLRNQITTIRQVMSRGGVGGKPLWITELGWGSAPPVANRPLIKGVEGQRDHLISGFELIESNRNQWNLAGVIWYSWRDPGIEYGNCPFCSSSGLLERNGDPKPSWFAYLGFTGGTDMPLSP